ncbi:unnamed protein product [Fraxinus pennsylvanica]|uniref:Uncharacterized protein n=1 Tax=Fraxinus pennsylvanica TaxID=56036 RepID=A0AAD2A4J5_9LAMI|nr:unnamed protein product [Fraxinus pennsylvanica]
MKKRLEPLRRFVPGDSAHGAHPHRSIATMYTPLEPLRTEAWQLRSASMAICARVLHFPIESCGDMIFSPIVEFLRRFMEVDGLHGSNGGVARGDIDAYSIQEGGGGVQRMKGLTFVTVRQDGHLVPSYQPQRELTMISSSLQGVLPPPPNDLTFYTPNKFSKDCDFFSYFLHKRRGQYFVGNAFFDDLEMSPCYYDYFWTHPLNSDDTHEEIFTLCDFVNFFDSCSYIFLEYYLNTAEVQRALHVKPTNWTICCGDIDANVLETVTRDAINNIKLPIENPWHAWYLNDEVGGYVGEYKVLTFVTVRGAGHLFPSDQPQRALTMISSFLQRILPYS